MQSARQRDPCLHPAPLRDVLSEPLEDDGGDTESWDEVLGQRRPSIGGRSAGVKLQVFSPLQRLFSLMGNQLRALRGEVCFMRMQVLLVFFPPKFLTEPPTPSAKPEQLHPGPCIGAELYLHFLSRQLESSWSPWRPQKRLLAFDWLRGLHEPAYPNSSVYSAAPNPEGVFGGQ